MPALSMLSPESPTPWEHKLLTTAPCRLSVRVLFALVSVHMVAIALPVWCLQFHLFYHYIDNSSRTELVAVNLVLSLWLGVLLTGGCCGVKAALTNSQTGATQTLGFWLFATLLHTWHLVVGVQMVRRQLYSSEAQSDIALPLMNWPTIGLHVVTDALTTAFLMLFIAVLRVREEENDAMASEILPLLTPKNEASEGQNASQV